MRTPKVTLLTQQLVHLHQQQLGHGKARYNKYFISLQNRQLPSEFSCNPQFAKLKIAIMT